MREGSPSPPVVCQFIYIYFFYKVVKLVGGGSVINGATPFSFFLVLMMKQLNNEIIQSKLNNHFEFKFYLPYACPIDVSLRPQSHIAGLAVAKRPNLDGGVGAWRLLDSVHTYLMEIYFVVNMILTCEIYVDLSTIQITKHIRENPKQILPKHIQL